MEKKNQTTKATETTETKATETKAVESMATLMETLTASISSINSAESKKDYESAKESLDKALKAVNDLHITERAAELSKLDTVTMFREYIDTPTANGVALSTDSNTGKIGISKEPKKLYVPLATLVESNETRQIVASPAWEKAVRVMKYCLVSADVADMKQAGKAAENPITIDDDMRVYADKHGLSLFGKKDKSGKYVGMTHAYLKETIIPETIKAILPAELAGNIQIRTADATYLLKAVTPTKSSQHNAKTVIRRDDTVIQELFTVVKAAMHKTAYDYKAEK